MPPLINSPAELPPNLILAESPCLPPQHPFHPPLTHPLLLIANRHQTPRKMFIVLAHQPVRDFKVVNVSKDEGPAANIGVLALDEGEGLIAPVTEGIQVVSGVVAVIEAEAVGLY